MANEVLNVSLPANYEVSQEQCQACGKATYHMLTRKGRKGKGKGQELAGVVSHEPMSEDEGCYCGVEPSEETLWFQLVQNSDGEFEGPWDDLEDEDEAASYLEDQANEDAERRAKAKREDKRQLWLQLDHLIITAWNKIEEISPMEQGDEGYVAIRPVRREGDSWDEECSEADATHVQFGSSFGGFEWSEPWLLAHAESKLRTALHEDYVAREVWIEKEKEMEEIEANS